MDDCRRFRSPQEKKPESRKPRKKKVPTAYDEYGRSRTNGLDLCDCFNVNCPGCWYDCEECGSNKCGLECRVNRQHFDDTLTFDGRNETLSNPAMLPKAQVKKYFNQSGTD